jgi:NADPH:quinone reductase-like Zn-dependent oxidoreductase
MIQQTTYRLPSKGSGYTSLVQKSEPIPKPAPHEVLLKIHATTLNYRDIVIANGGYPFPVKDDVVPLSDGAGTIEEVGDAAKATGLEKGDWAIVNFDVTNLYGPQQGMAKAIIEPSVRFEALLTDGLKIGTTASAAPSTACSANTSPSPPPP